MLTRRAFFVRCQPTSVRNGATHIINRQAPTTHDRRHFLRLTGALALTASGCAGGPFRIQLRRSPDIAQIAPDVSRGFVDAIVNAYDGLPAPIRAGLQTYNYRIDVVRSLPESLPEVAPYALLGVAGLHRPRHIVLSEFVLHPANRLKRSDLSGAIVLRHEVGHAADWIHSGPRQSMLSSSPGFIRALRIDLARLRTASQRAKAKTSAQQLGFPWYDDFAVHTARGRGELFAITFAAMLNGQIGPHQREILTSFSRTRTFIDRTVMWV